MKSTNRLATIRNLLAKAEATTFPAEAELFIEKASELMAAHAISEAMLWDAQDKNRSVPIERRIKILRPFVNQKSILVSAVASNYSCRTVLFKDHPNGNQQPIDIISIVGFESDVELVETLVTSLMVQLTSAIAREPTGRSSSETASFRRSYIMGFTETICARLKRDRAEAATAADNDPEHHSAAGDPARETPPHQSTAVVLAVREEEVDAALKEKFPHVRTSRISMGGSSNGRIAGAQAGRNADLGHSRFAGKTPLGSG